MNENMTIQDFKYFINYTIKGIYPEVENEFNIFQKTGITYDNVLNQIVFLLIKMEYEKYADKKSLRQHIENKHGKGSYNDLKRSYQQGLKFISQHKTTSYDYFKNTLGSEIPELLPKKLNNIDKKLEGYKYTNVQFSEICTFVGKHKNKSIEAIHLLNKMYGHQIEDSHKVSEDKFIEYFQQYDNYINDLRRGMTSDIKVIEKTIEYYQLEMSYFIDFRYSIIEAAMENNLEGFTNDQLWYISLLISPYNNIPPVEWYPCNITYSANWMSFYKSIYIEDIFNKDALWWTAQKATFYNANRLIAMVTHAAAINEILEMIHEKISNSEKASFIIKHFCIFDKHQHYEWEDPKKIKLFRKLASQLPIF